MKQSEEKMRKATKAKSIEGCWRVMAGDGWTPRVGDIVSHDGSKIVPALDLATPDDIPLGLVMEVRGDEIVVRDLFAR